MSYVPGSKMILSAEFADPGVPLGYQAAYRDPVHSPTTCLVCAGGPVQNGAGVWRLRTKINPATLMPNGSQRKITSIVTKGMSDWTAGAWTSFAECTIAILGDGTQIFKSGPLSHDPSGGAGAYATNLFKDLNIPVDAYAALDVVISQEIVMISGWAAVHDFDITIAYGYLSTAPPVYGNIDVAVTNADTGLPVAGVMVYLMQGATEVKKGTTDSTGTILWNNIIVGDYIAETREIPPSLWSIGYEKSTTPVTVTANATSSLPINLATIPATGFPVLPWYAWAGIAGVGAIGALFYFRRPAAPAITYIREAAPRVARRGYEAFRRGYGAEEEE